MVTASHNPPDYNGMKFVREQSRPISGDTGLKDIQRIAEADVYSTRGAGKGTRLELDVRGKYIEHLLSYLDRAEAQEAQDRRQRRQRRRRAGRRPARAASAVRVHQDQSRAGRHVSERRAESDARGEPRLDDRGDPQARAPTAASPGTATTTAASCSTRAASSSRATTSSGCLRRCSSSASAARASCTIRA